MSSLLSDQIFCSRKRFANFKNLKITKKRLNSFIFFRRDSLFLYHNNNNNNNNKIHILFFNNYAQFDLTVLNQRWFFFHFRPDYFTIVFLDILIIRIVNYRWLSLFLWFHHLTILILLYYDSDCSIVLNSSLIVVLSLKVLRVKLSKKFLDFLVC